MSDKRQRSRPQPSLTVRDALLRELRDFVAKEGAAQRETKAWWKIMKDADASLRDLLAGEASIEEFRAEHMRADGHGTSRLSLTSLVNWLMNRASEVGAEDTINELERYVTSPTFPVCFSIGIRGASSTGDIQLADGVEFVPRPEPDRSDYAHESPISTGTLTVVVDYPKATAPADKPLDEKQRRAEAVRTDSFERLSVARMCMAIVLNSSVVETSGSAVPKACVPSSGSRSSWFAADSVPNVPLRPFRTGEVEFLKNFHRRFTELPRDLKARMTVALHRWHACFLHPAMSPDVFIDLGIGFEAVFVSEKAPEIRYRLSIRGARLLAENSIAARTRMSRILETIYDARSDAVHTGRISRKIPADVAPSLGHLAMDAEELLRRAIIAMVYRSKDDWHELEFG